MKKTEVRWISRDSDGLYCWWRVRPKWRRAVQAYTGEGYVSNSASHNNKALGFVLKYGGLAKITIERQY